MVSKSIIGIDTNNPPYILLKWLEQYISQFEPEFNASILDSKKPVLEVLSYKRLNDLIKKQDSIKVFKYLDQFLLSAAPISIAEYFLEYAASESALNLLYCWSVLRAIQFVGEKKGFALLYSGASNLMMKGFDIKNKEALYYELYCHSFQIKKENMVRGSKIIPKLDRLLLTIDNDSIYSIHQALPKELKNELSLLK